MQGLYLRRRVPIAGDGGQLKGVTGVCERDICLIAQLNEFDSYWRRENEYCNGSAEDASWREKNIGNHRFLVKKQLISFQYHTTSYGDTYC